MRHRRGWLAGMLGVVRLLSAPGTALWRAVGSIPWPHHTDPMSHYAVLSSPPLPGQDMQGEQGGVATGPCGALADDTSIHACQPPRGETRWILGPS